MKLLKILIIVLSLLQPFNSYALPAFPQNYEKKRVIISTDIGGGDSDDTQSMIHFLLYSDMFDLEGIVISRPRGDVSEVKRVIRAYRRDYKNLSFHSADYITPGELSKLVKIGAPAHQKASPRGYDNPTQGSNWIIKQALKDDPRPLYILSWGAVTDVAQAIHDKPSIKDKIKYFAIADYYQNDYNVAMDPSPYGYLVNNHKDLRWISGNSTVRGLYLPGMNSNAKYGNVGFVTRFIKNRGALGRLFYRISKDINVNHYGIKMGDTGSLLFLMNGDFDDPTKESWGGKYCKVRGNFYADCQGPGLGIYDGAHHVAKYRKQILKDFEQRLKRLDPISSPDLP